MRSGRVVVRVLLALVVVAVVVVVGANLLTNYLLRQPLVDACYARVAGGTTRLSIEEAENAALIAALSVRRGMPARAATIALATAFQESSLRNIDYGHLDSLGLFQQRPSQGWGTPEEILDPYYATERFYRALDDVPRYTELDIAVAAQEVQRSADGSAYAQHETSARALASSLTGHSPAAFSCELREAPTSSDPDGLRREFGKAFGADLEAAADGAVEFPASKASTGWAVAQWAAAYAQRFGVVSISYDGRSWSADHSHDGWRDDAEAPSDRVRLVLASPT